MVELCLLKIICCTQEIVTSKCLFFTHNYTCQQTYWGLSCSGSRFSWLHLHYKGSLSLTGSASRTDVSQLANGIWEIHAGCPSFLRVSSVAKIGYIPQFKASNARDQDEVLSDLARLQWVRTLFLLYLSDQDRSTVVQLSNAVAPPPNVVVPLSKVVRSVDQRSCTVVQRR